MEILDMVTVEHLDEENAALAQLIGIENFRKLVKSYGGSPLYIPKAESIARAVRNERIRSEFDGGNVRELAARYGLTESWVREIVSDRCDGEIPGQMSIFDIIGE